MITRKELIEKFTDFYKSKDHKVVQNASLIPENDPTVLFTTAGMHPLVPYLLGQDHPQGKRLVNVQRCVRTGDIEEVGNETHHTFLEMIGKWSLGDYFKREAIEYTFEFLTKVLNVDLNRLAVTVFAGDSTVPKDDEAAEVWKSLGIPTERIAYLGRKDNWWETPGPGPCGPDTEIFYWKDNSSPAPKEYDPSDKNWVELGNDVLMQYEKDSEGNYVEAKQKNIDFGGGLARMLAALNGYSDNYKTDIWQPLIKKIEERTGKSYEGNEKEMRIIADHFNASTFIIADGITPSNTEQGYILRRLIRRGILNFHKLGVKEANLAAPLVEVVLQIYDDYDHLRANKEKILSEIQKEEAKFEKTLEKGLKEFEKMKGEKEISGTEAFLLFQSYGFPVEMAQELAKEQGLTVNMGEFNTEQEKHQELSRTASAGKFKSGLSENTEKTTKLHTATHLLNESLRVVLDDPSIHQKGSNITEDRLRFDFNFPRKLTPEELIEVEKLVNLKIQSNLPIRCENMHIDQAKDIGAQGVFDDKYDDHVKVYFIGAMNEEFSKELCGGPHVDNTSELGTFKILKEESSSSGVRRIKATVE